jgi:hypothetical protein
LTPEQLTTLAGGGLSLVASRVPGVEQWYKRLPPDMKRLVMFAAILVVAIATTLWACWGGEGVCTSRETWEATLHNVLLAVGVGYGVYGLTPERKPKEPRPNRRARMPKE